MSVESTNIKLKKFLTLRSDEIHIWSACLLENGKDIFYYVSILSKDEHERANSYRFPIDQKRFIITRGILRCLLAKYLDQKPETIEIIYGLWGKPCVSQEKLLHMPVCFNISHSKDYALYAIASQCEVGIDLEYIDRSLDLEDIALSLFSTPELTRWKQMGFEEKVFSFFKFWVCQEAYLKALGKGWLAEQQKLTLNFCNEPQKKGLQGKVTTPYYFECIPGYASALCVNGACLRPFHYTWDQHCLEF